MRNQKNCFTLHFSLQDGDVGGSRSFSILYRTQEISDGTRYVYASWAYKPLSSSELTFESLGSLLLWSIITWKATRTTPYGIIIAHGQKKLKGLDWDNPACKHPLPIHDWAKPYVWCPIKKLCSHSAWVSRRRTLPTKRNWGAALPLVKRFTSGMAVDRVVSTHSSFQWWEESCVTTDPARFQGWVITLEDYLMGPSQGKAQDPIAAAAASGLDRSTSNAFRAK